MSGRGASAESDNRRNAKFDNTHQMAGHTVTRVELLNIKWDVYDYGDTVTGVENDPRNDARGCILNERNQCLVLHLEAGIELMNKGGADMPTSARVNGMARLIRWDQHNQVRECASATDPVGERTTLW